jgi:CubicO group peptidase (beta-lactamase class C family)
MFVLVLQVLSGCGALSNREIDSRVGAAIPMCRTADLHHEVDALGEGAISSGETPGMVIGVRSRQHGEFFRAFGVADSRSRRPIRYDDLFQVGSLSKGMLASIVRGLEARGVLASTDTLGALIPNSIVWSAAARGISVQQLIRHESGLPRQPYRPIVLRAFVDYLFDGSNFYGVFDREFTDVYLSEFDGSSAGVFNYSNIGYGLLGMAVESRTGRSLDDLLTEFVVGPYGLSSTFFEHPARVQSNARARGHAGDQPLFIERGAPMEAWQFTDVMRGAAGATSNAPDLLRFVIAGEQSPRVRSVVEGLLGRSTPDGRGIAHVDGWTIDKVRGVVVAYQVGLVGGYSSYVGLDIAKGNAIVVLQNSFNWVDRVGHSLLVRMSIADDLHARCRSISSARISTTQRVTP